MSDDDDLYKAFNDPAHPMIVAAGDRLRVMPADLLLCVQAVSVSRRGSTEWSEYDLLMTESCLGTFCKAVIARNNEERYLRATLAKGPPPSAADPAHQSEGESDV